MFKSAFSQIETITKYNRVWKDLYILAQIAKSASTFAHVDILIVTPHPPPSGGVLEVFGDVLEVFWGLFWGVDVDRLVHPTRRVEE